MPEPPVTPSVPPCPNPKAYQSLQAYLRDSLNWSLEYAAHEGTPNWQNGVFHFVRLVKSHPHFEGKPYTEAVKLLRANLPSWGPKFEMPLGDAEIELRVCWEKIRYLRGGTPIGTAIQYSREDPLTVKVEGQTEDKNEVIELYDSFVSLCAWLCIVVGARKIAIPCREFAVALGCSSITVSRMRQLAVKDGFLKLRNLHKRPKNGAPGEATTFYFAIWQWGDMEERLENHRRKFGDQPPIRRGEE